MNVSRRDFFSIFGVGAAAAALPGCCCPPANAPKRAKIALQLYSIRQYIGGLKDKNGNIVKPGVGLAKAFRNIRAIGYRGVEFAGYYDNDPKTLKAMLDDNGLVACGTHIDRLMLAPDKLEETCEFNLGFGNNLLICPGGHNFPGKGENLDDFMKMLVEFYSRQAEAAAKFGCRIGLHNHTREFDLKLKDGTTYWDYFFKNTPDIVCMEQDVGWTTCAGADPVEQFEKYPHRSPTIHAKENGMGKGVKKFDAILGKPGIPGAVGVDWDALVPATEKDGVEWYVVECEEHCDELSAVLESCNFLKAKGLN